MIDGGGAGIDMLRFDPSGSGITFDQRTGTGSGGDAQGDTYTNIEGSFGTDENDTFIIDYHSGGKFAGGDGTDTFDLTITPEEANSGKAFEFKNDAGVEILWGGSGGEKDIYKLDEDAQIAVVQIDNLTEEQFATLTYDDLGLNDLPYKPSVVLINPDSNDEIILSSLTKPLDSDYTDPYTDTYERVLDITDNRVASTLAELGVSGARDYYSYEASNGHGGAEETLQEGWVWSESVTSGGVSLEVFGALTSLDGIPGPETFLLPPDTYAIPNTWSMIGAEIHGTSIDLSKGSTLKINLGSDDDDDQDGSGDDENFNGSGGADNINGQGGRDTVNYAQSYAAVTVDLANSVTAGGFADGDTLTNIENIRGSEFSDTLNGNEQTNTLSGGSGDDSLTGGGGDDALIGGAGADTFHFGAGDGHDVIGDFELGYDELVIDGNEVDLLAPGAGIVVTQTADDILVEYGGNDRVLLKGVDLAPNDIFDGTSGDDVIVTGSTEGQGDVIDHSGNTIFGNAGDDHISAGDGSDLIFGGDGDDTIYGRKGWDTIYGGNGNDTISGNKGVNTLYGDAGNDTIHSGEHSSKLYGGTGDDTLIAHFKKNAHHTLTGGEGADSFVFNLGSTSKFSRATVTDFELGNDRLIIDGNEVDLQAPGAGIDVTETDDGILVEFNDNEWVMLEGVFDLV